MSLYQGNLIITRFYYGLVAIFEERYLETEKMILFTFDIY